MILMMGLPRGLLGSLGQPDLPVQIALGGFELADAGFEIAPRRPHREENAYQTQKGEEGAEGGERGVRQGIT